MGGGGGAKTRLCAARYPLNPNLFLYTLLFTFYFFVIASKCIAQVWQAIKSKMLCQIDCHAKNRSRSFLLAMTARLVILSVAKNPQRLKENLPFLDTSLALSMTNSGFCLKIMDIFTQILKQKFKFFTQNSKHFINSRHFINSTHFITLTQILSHTQGFFISLPQVFAQCKLIKNFLQGGHCV